MPTSENSLWQSIHRLLNHPLIFHAKQKVATNEYRLFKNAFSPFLRFGDIRDARVLDVGCGTGLCSHHLFSDKANEIFGIDISLEYVTWAKRLYPHNHFVCGGADHMPFPKNFFDYVILSSILHHLPDHTSESLFAGIKSACKPDAKIIISEPIWSDDRLSNFLLRHDRGKYVKTAEEYLALLGSTFQPEKQFLFRYARTNFLGVIARA